MSEEKNPVQKAMEKDCIILIAANIIANRDTPPSEKCRGPACGQYNIFNNKCGFSR